jgi:hypothetical protein
MRKFLLAIILGLPLTCFAQNKIGILCNDFKINNEERAIGGEFRKTFESVLSILKYPPNIIEREKVPDLLLLIQEEKNLYNDFGNSTIKVKLEAALVDYVVYGNFHKPFVSDEYEFQLEFVKVSGKNVLSKRVFPIIRFSENELNGTKYFENKIKTMLDEVAFSSEFGIIEESQLSNFEKRLDEKDVQISNLENLIQEKIAQEENLEKLKKTPPDVDFELALIDSSLVIKVKFNNDVPIEISPWLHNFGPWECENHDKSYDIFRRAHQNPIKIYPPKNGEDSQEFVFDVMEKGDSLPTDKYLCIRMIVRYSSIYAAEIQKPELQEKSVNVDYAIEPNTGKFIKVEFKE